MGKADEDGARYRVRTCDPSRVKELSGRDKLWVLLTAETDAAGVTTTYSESYNVGTGETTKTITYAHGTPEVATRIEVYARNGSLLKVTGSAVNPLRYEYGVEADTDGTQRLYQKEIKLDAAGNDTPEP